MKRFCFWDISSSAMLLKLLYILVPDNMLNVYLKANII